MKFKKLLIAKGNPTMLVWDCLSKDKLRIAKKYLKEVEQVGFVTTKNKISSLTMMGNELCINATIALASLLKKTGFFYSNGLKIKYKNTQRSTCIEIPLAYEEKNNLVIFDGIGFRLVKKYKNISKKEISNLAKKYNLPAFGIIIYKGKKIEPYIYVREMNSLVQETACGSGSIAANIITGEEKITQPSKGVISIKNKAGIFKVCTTVQNITETC